MNTNLTYLVISWHIHIVEMAASREGSPIFRRRERGNEDPGGPGPPNNEGEDSLDEGQEHEQNEVPRGENLADGYRVTLGRDLEAIASRITDEQTLEDIYGLYASCCQATLDAVLDMINQFETVDLDTRLFEVLKGSTESLILASKMNGLCRIRTMPSTIEQRNLLVHNFKAFTLAFDQFSALTGALADDASQIIEARSSGLPEEEITRLFAEAFKLAVFVRKCISAVIALTGRVYDYDYLEKVSNDWRATVVLLTTLHVPIHIRLKCLKLRSQRATQQDFETIQAFLITEFNKIASLEERVSKHFESLFSFVTSAATHRLGLSHRSQELVEPLLRKLEDIFNLAAVGDTVRPPLILQFEELLLNQPEMKLNPELLNVTHHTLETELNKILTYAEQLNTCQKQTCDEKPISLNPPIKLPPRKEGDIFKDPLPDPLSTIDEELKILVADSERIFAGINSQCDEMAKLLATLPLDNLEPLHSPYDHMVTRLSWGNAVLLQLRTAARDIKLSAESRTYVIQRIEKFDSLILKADGLVGQYKRRKDVNKLQTDSRSRLMTKSLSILSIPKWPPVTGSGTKKHPEEVDHSLLLFLSDLLSWSSDPLLSEQQKHRKLASLITDSSIKECILQNVTFSLAVSWLLSTFSPDRNTLFRISKGISRLGHPLGAQTEEKELRNLIKISNIKYKILKGHFLLDLIGKCHDPSPAHLSEIGRNLKSESFLSNLVLESVHVVKPLSLLDEKELAKDSDEYKILQQHKILLSYQINKELFASFNKRCMTTRTQLNFQVMAASMNVDLNIDAQYHHFFWFFINIHLKHLSSTSAGLKTRLEVQSNSHKNNTNFFYEISSSEEEESCINLMGNSKSTSKNKKLKKKANKKRAISSQNMNLEDSEYVFCPLKGHEGKHRPYACAEFLKGGAKGAMSNGICAACLVRKLSESHSPNCKPHLLRTKNGKREQIALFCKRCPRVSLGDKNISCYQNNRICKCSKGKLNKVNYVPATSGKTSPGPSTKASSSTKFTKSKATKHKSKITKKALNLVTNDSSDSEESSNVLTEDILNNTVDEKPESDPDSSSSDTTEPEETVVNYSQAQGSSNSEESDSQYDSPELGSEQVLLIQVSGEDLEPDEETESHAINHVGESSSSVVDDIMEPIEQFTLMSVSRMLLYTNEPNKASFLLSETLYFLSVTGDLRKYTAIYDGGSQRCVLNTRIVSPKYSYRFLSKFRISTVQSDTVNPNKDKTFKADIVVTGTENPKLEDFKKLSCLCLNFSQGLSNCQLQLDSSTCELIKTSQQKVGTAERHSNLGLIIGVDGKKVFPVEIYREGNLSLYKSRWDGRKIIACGIFPKKLRKKLERDLETIGINLLLWDNGNLSIYDQRPTTQGYLDKDLSTQDASKIWGIQETPTEHEHQENPLLEAICKHQLSFTEHESNSDAPFTSCMCQLGASATCECTEGSVIEDNWEQTQLTSSDESDTLSSLSSCDTEYDNCLSDERKLRHAKELNEMRQHRNMGWLEHQHLLQSGEDVDAGTKSLTLSDAHHVRDLELEQLHERIAELEIKNQLLEKNCAKFQENQVKEGERMEYLEHKLRCVLQDQLKYDWLFEHVSSKCREAGYVVTDKPSSSSFSESENSQVECESDCSSSIVKIDHSEDESDQVIFLNKNSNPLLGSEIDAILQKSMTNQEQSQTTPKWPTRLKICSICQQPLTFDIEQHKYCLPNTSIID